MAEELNGSLEYTPTWIVAVVCTIIVFISFGVERGLHHLGKHLERKNEALHRALEKLKEELMLLGFISLLLTVFQVAISQICIPRSLATHMLPCTRPHESTTGSAHDLIYYNTIINRRRLFSEETRSEHCVHKGKIPLLSLESLHHLHIFIFVLAVVHVVFCVTTMVLGGAKIRRWKRWEDDVREKISKSKGRPGSDNTHASYQEEFLKTHAEGFWRKAAVVGWLRAFFKQFHGSVTKSDYIALRHGFIKEHCPGDPTYDFHKYMMWALEDDFKKVVGISWYLWLFVVLFLLLDLQGWHTYFWLAFLPLILLLLVGAKLEYIISRLAQESVQQKSEGEDQEAAKVVGIMRGKKKQDAARVKPSDKHFWFNRPALVLDLIHFILFQNSFEIAFFFWILCTYGFDSCIMEKIAFIITRLIMGVIVQVLCSYSTLPLYALVTQMGSRYKFKETVATSLRSWHEGTKGGAAGDSSATTTTQSQKMVKERTQEYVQFGEQAVKETAVELACIVESSSKEPYAVN